ncbi:anthranilate phosphoribosyltransferase [Candidatus Sumerlaeota bacterium]|nr:anthranilate phosphoribosyltransferase [Candidatus Sumerlaeota bacterium]
MIQDGIALLLDDEELRVDQAREIAQEILNGEATPCQIAAFITALRIRGESVEHILAFAETLRGRAAKVQGPEGIILDTCGTGGDAVGTFNVSTTAALIAAGAGVCVAKHGNRAVSSTCGSADVLAELGVNIGASLEVVEKCLNEIGICFLFAPSHHSAMKHAAVPRREIGIRTIFNMIGPLSNPAGATHQVVGVYAPHLTETFAKVLRELGSERALVVHGSDGIDEVTTTSVTQVTELRDGEIETWTLSPNDFGIEPASVEDLVVDSAQEAAQEIRNILSGQKGPRMDMALVNAAAALYVAGRAASVPDAYGLALDAITSNRAMEKLEALVEMSNAS